MSDRVRNYSEYPSLSGIYLEDSFVLRILETPGELRFALEAVLTEAHPGYHPPDPGEQHCYLLGDLYFDDCERIEWSARAFRKYRDATGAEDLGNIDSLTDADGVYSVEGDWGQVRIWSDTLPRFVTDGPKGIEFVLRLAATDLTAALENSHSPDSRTRIGSIPLLGAYLDQIEARQRLEQLTAADPVVTVRIDAAEQLVRYGGVPGLLAVLEALGREPHDPDTDYVAYLLSDLDNLGEFPVLRTALAIEPARLSENVKRGLADLRVLLRR